jgi:hypothetical protein
MIIIIVYRTDIHRARSFQNCDTVSASTLSYSAWLPTNLMNAIWARKLKATISLNVL